MLDNILGGTSSSRLFQEVREKRGLAYSVYSFQSLYAGSGQIGLYLGTRPDNVARAMRRGGRRARALPRRTRHRRGARALQGERQGPRAARAGVDHRAHEPPGSSVLADMPLLSVDEVEARIDAVALDDLSELAGELLAPERLSAAGIGADESAFRAALEPVSEALAA